MRLCARLIALCAASFFTLPAYPAAYSGKVSLVENGKPAAVEEYDDVIVYVVPKTPAPVMPLQDGTEMRMEKKSFVPRVLVVTQGTEVRFPNFDPILHNAFSTTSNNSFDLQLYGGGEIRTHKFDRTGLVRMYCNVHHDMVGYIVVLNTPYYTKVTPAGEFSLKDVPADGEIYLWHPRGDVLKQPLGIAQDSAAIGEFKLDLTQRRIPRHVNKEGRSYRRSRGGAY